MEFGSIKNQVDPHCVFTRYETDPEIRVSVRVALKIEESTKTELLSISGPLIVPEAGEEFQHTIYRKNGISCKEQGNRKRY